MDRSAVSHLFYPCARCSFCLSRLGRRVAGLAVVLERVNKSRRRERGDGMRRLFRVYPASSTQVNILRHPMQPHSKLVTFPAIYNFGTCSPCPRVGSVSVYRILQRAPRLCPTANYCPLRRVAFICEPPMGASRHELWSAPRGCFIALHGVCCGARIPLRNAISLRRAMGRKNPPGGRGTLRFRGGGGGFGTPTNHSHGIADEGARYDT